MIKENVDTFTEKINTEKIKCQRTSGAGSTLYDAVTSMHWL